MHGPDARCDLVARDVFEDVAVGASPHGLEEVGLFVGHRQHDDACGGHPLADGLARLDPTAPGHPHVHEHDIGNRRFGAFYRGHPVIRLVDDNDVAVEFQDRAQASTEQRVVISDQHPDRVFTGPAIGHPFMMARVIGSRLSRMTDPGSAPPCSTRQSAGRWWCRARVPDEVQWPGAGSRWMTP